MDYLIFINKNGLKNNTGKTVETLARVSYVIFHFLLELRTFFVTVKTSIFFAFGCLNVLFGFDFSTSEMTSSCWILDIDVVGFYVLTS